MQRNTYILWVAVLLIAMSGGVWGQEEVIYSTGFESSEGFTASTTYNNTTVRYDGPPGQQWGTYYGTPSTTSPIIGLQSLQMRWYASAPSNLGYTYTNFDLSNVTKVTFYAKKYLEPGASIEVSFSTDGGSTYTGNQTYTLSSSASSYEFVVSSTGEYPSLRIKFQIIYPSGNPTNTDRVIIDDISVYGMPTDEPVISIDPLLFEKFFYDYGYGPSEEKIFTISGSNLTDDITITAPTNYEISQTSGSSFTSTVTLTETDGSVYETTIYIRLKAGLNVGKYESETIIASSTGASNVTVICNGLVSNTRLVGADYVEDFSNSNATSTYTENSFTGNNGVTWTYVHSRDENGDANNSGIDGNALMLRRVSDGSKVYSEAVPGGIKDFYVRLYKGFTGSGDRQVELYVNGVSKGTSINFDDYDEHIFTVNDINISGDVVIELINTTGNQIIVDDISWTSYEDNFIEETISTGNNINTTFTGTNVNLSFDNVSTGSNVRVAKYNYGPHNVSFEGTAPTNYSDYKWIIHAGALAFTGGTIKIATEGLAGIGNPDAVDIYKRSTAGTGAFTKLETSYSDGYLSASIDGFSEFILGSNDGDNSLPVELQKFNAIPGSGEVTLCWTTESETENLGFIIQRRQKTACLTAQSKQGEWKQVVDYTTCEALQGQGSTSEAHEYSYTDAQVVPGATYLYRLGDVDYSGKVTWHEEVEVKVEVESAQLPLVFGLQPAYPNPFNPETTLRFQLGEAAYVQVQVYDLLGNLVATLTDGRYPVGRYNLHWNGCDDRGRLSSTGIYFIHIKSSTGFTSTQKVVFLR